MVKGFVLESMMYNMKKELSIRRIQKISLEILKIIADICEKKGFKYFLVYGTLIGAIRHKGFIPWDDDVDIMMPRDDYDALLHYLINNYNEKSYLKVFNPDTCKDYPYMITRICDIRYYIKVKNEKFCGMGAFIDIYPFDGLGNDKKEALKYGLKGDMLSSLCFLSTREKNPITVEKKLLKKIIKTPLFYFSKLIGKNFFQKRLSSLVKKFEYDQSNYVGCVVWLSGGEKDIFPRKWFDEYLVVPFEKYKFRIPKDYDLFLKHIYGEYMKLPPLEDRYGHHEYSVYKKIV